MTDDALGSNVLSLSGADFGSFSIVDVLFGELWFNGGANYEVKNAYDVTVNVDDASVGGTPDAAQSFHLAITDVNDAPVAVPVTLAAIAEDSGTRLITQAELLAGVSDVDGPGLSITALSIQSGQGSLVNNNNGTWSYTPALNDDTGVTFSYTASDGTLTASSTATLDITPVDDAPVAVPVTLAAIAEDSGTRLITQAELLAGVSDVDGPGLSITALSIQSARAAWSTTTTAAGATRRR